MVFTGDLAPPEYFLVRIGENDTDFGDDVLDLIVAVAIPREGASFDC